LRINFFMIGKTINNYLIESKLGDGGMGEVFYARHNKVDREVAIKVLHSHLFQNETIHNRFKNEANALIKLNHPNIVKIYDYVEQENFACLIMEYISGYTLDVYISKFTGPLPAPKATFIMCAVLDAVQYAHDNKIFHRDIKPANIMISKDGSRVSIMDFGIAKLTDSKNFQTTHANTQLGTPFYMSPEQIKGLPYTRMSDIYSLGVTLFEMVTGKCPYHKITSLFELQLQIVNEPLPEAKLYYPDVSNRLQYAISQATQKLPENRFQTCNEFKQYLVDTEETFIQAPSVPSVKNQNRGKRNLKVYIFSAIALLLVAAAVVFYVTIKPITKTSSAESNQPNIPADSTGSKIGDAAKPLESVPASASTEKNLALLNIYIANKEKESKTKLSPKLKAKLYNQVGKSNRVLTRAELAAQYDPYFVAPVAAKSPSDDQLIDDFWTKIPGMPCKIPFENRSQISGIYFDKPAFNAYNPPEELQITVRFAITEAGETDKNQCSLRLSYTRSGNSYTCTK